jgi:AraC-like DNA-binding protein
MRPGDVLLKSRQAVHEDEFGDAGATLLALEFRADDPFAAPDTTNLWRPRSDAVAMRHATALLEAALNHDECSVSVAGADLVADCCDHPPQRSRPDWIKRLAIELEERSLADISVASRAREAGVHPAHASRLFRQCHGRSITEYAQAHSVRRALAGLAQFDQPLSQVAASAGFYDQSHMNRVFRRVIGRSPQQQRSLLVAAR